MCGTLAETPRLSWKGESSKFRSSQPKSFTLFLCGSFVDLPVPEEVKLPGWGGQRGGGQVDRLELPPKGRGGGGGL